MSQVADHGLTRLLSLLPLPERQASLSLPLRKLHQAFLHALVERGRPLTRVEIAAGAPAHDGFSAVWTLAALDLLTLDRNGHPVGAYPITAEPTPHEITVNGNTLWAMCALDAVSVAPMFNLQVSIRSRCPVTAADITIAMDGRRLLAVSPGDGVQVGVWWRDPGPVAARSFCPGVTFLRDRVAAEYWAHGRTVDHDVASLEDAVEIGARFFAPLLAETPLPVGV